MRVVRLNGELGKKYGRVHKLDVRTPAEAVRALIANFPGFQQDLAASHEKGVGYKCIVDREAVGEDQLSYPMSKSFSITPVVMGAGKVLSIIAGVVLIAAAIAFPGITPVFSAFGTTFAFSSSAAFLLGGALILGGVAQMLAPTPKTNDGKTNENPYFNGPVNTVQQGVPVPVGYGRAIVGSAVISASITTQENVYYNFGDYDFYIGGFNIP